MELKNDHNVYIIGAGFSFDAGLPLIANFLRKMRDSHEWLLAHGRNREADSVEKVLKFRLQAASASYWINLDLENIEELFSLSSATRGGVASQTKLAIAATLEYARASRSPLVSKINFRDSELFAIRKDKYPRWLKPEPVDTSVQHNQ